MSCINVGGAITKYLTSVGGAQCQVCNEWHSKNGQLSICDECEEEIQEVVSEADNW